jgi:ParB/RepB/Spo0J family partition protein
MGTLTTKPLRIEDWPLEQFKPHKRELERHDDPEKTRQRGESMLARGQLQPVAATEDGRMIFGHGRYLAAKAAGIKTLEVKVYPASLTDTEFRLIRAAENLQRNELTGYQKWLLCADLMCGNPDWLQKDLAEKLNVSEKMVTVNLSPSRCTVAWQEALKAGKVGNSDCYAASKLPESEQAGLLALKLSGASRDQIEQAGRKRRNARGESVRMSRVKISMPRGMSVVVSGNDLGMSELVELLSQTLAAARKAAEQYDVKTFQSMMKDRAKAG